MPHTIDFTSYKILSFSFKDTGVIMKVGIIVAINELFKREVSSIISPWLESPFNKFAGLKKKETPVQVLFGKNFEIFKSTVLKNIVNNFFFSLNINSSPSV